jgi:hypothetical protein
MGMKRRILAGVALASAICAVSAAQAAVIVAPVKVVLEQGGVVNNSPFYAVDNVMDQSGLSVSYEAGVTDFDAYVASGVRHSGALNTEWASQRNITTSRMTFDFGREINIFKLAMWDENNTSIGQLAFSTPALGQFLAFNPKENTGAPYGVSQVVTFAPITTRYLTLDFSGCASEPESHTASGCGLGEIIFADASGAVPEPATWALMIGGFGMAGAMLRRRRTALARA